MGKQKRLIILISIILFVICILGISLLILNRNDSKKQAEENLKNGEGDPETIIYNMEILDDPTKFFSVEDAIKKHINENFVAEDMRILNGMRIVSYSVKGKLRDVEEELYFIFRVDMQNNTFDIEEVKNVKNIDSINLENNITEILDNGNNYFEYSTVNTEEMCRKYLQDFKEKELTNPQEAYLMLDEEYKNIRFPTYDIYLDYLNNCRNMIEESVLIQYYAESKEDYNEYILVDNYENAYTIRTKGIWDYKIMLDNYTIKVDSYEENYAKLSDEEKIQANVHIFLQMINTNDYNHAYELLDNTFKTNNFETLDKFKEYMNNNFFKYNLDTASEVLIQNQGSTYIYETVIRSSAASAAQRKNLTVIMQLREGTDFVMSFSVE